MTKFNYTATFSILGLGQGVKTRRSEREYAAAWCIKWQQSPTSGRYDAGRTYVKSGFARTRELAERALATEKGNRGADDFIYGAEVVEAVKS